MDRNVKEFVDTFGPPRDPLPVTDSILDAARDRVPDSLIEFWQSYGVGEYADGNLRLCTPDLFDPLLERLLENVPDLQGKLTAFAHTSMADVNLWHQDGRHYTLMLPYAILRDATSFVRTDPLPIGLDEIYELAGVSQNNTVGFPHVPEGPENLWMILFIAASHDTYQSELDDNDQSIYTSLARQFGKPHRDEFYLRKGGDAGLEYLATSYFKATLHEVIAQIPGTIKLTFAVEHGEGQQVNEIEFPIGR